MSESECTPRRLHPATLISRSLRILPQMLAGGAGYAAVVQREGFGRILLFAAFAAGLGLLGALISWWRFRYTIAPGEIIIESGVFHRQRRVIPFDRVQDIAIERRLLARLLGTAKVKIETGGSAADEGQLDMVDLAEAYVLRDRIRRWRGADEFIPEAPTQPEATQEALLFEMTVPRILFAGLFNFSLVFLAILFGGFQYLDDFGLLRIEDWVTAERAEDASRSLSIRATIGLIALLLFLGLLAGMARTMAREFGFRLTRAASGFRRRRGLLTLSEAVIPIHRVQVGVIQSGALTGRFGWHGLSFQTLGADQKEGGVQAAAPFARIDEIAPLLAEAGFPTPPPPEIFNGLPRRALLSWALPWVVLAGIAAVAAGIFDPRAGIASILLLILGLIAILRWRKHSWVIGDEALMVKSGLLSRRIWIIPFEKAQSISVYQGPIQRRLSLATLLIDTAGASLLRAPEIIDMDVSEAHRLAAALQNLFHRERARRRASRG